MRTQRGRLSIHNQPSGGWLCTCVHQKKASQSVAAKTQVIQHESEHVRASNIYRIVKSDTIAHTEENTIESRLYNRQAAAISEI